MKRKHFKPWVRKVLSTTTIASIMLLAGLEDFNNLLGGLIFVLSLLIITGLNLYLLSKY